MKLMEQKLAGAAMGSAMAAQGVAAHSMGSHAMGAAMGMVVWVTATWVKPWEVL